MVKMDPARDRIFNELWDKGYRECEPVFDEVKRQNYADFRGLSDETIRVYFYVWRKQAKKNKSQFQKFIVDDVASPTTATTAVNVSMPMIIDGIRALLPFDALDNLNALFELVRNRCAALESVRAECEKRPIIDADRRVIHHLFSSLTEIADSLSTVLAVHDLSRIDELLRVLQEEQKRVFSSAPEAKENAGLQARIYKLESEVREERKKFGDSIPTHLAFRVHSLIASNGVTMNGDREHYFNRARVLFVEKGRDEDVVMVALEKELKLQK